MRIGSKRRLLGLAAACVGGLAALPATAAAAVTEYAPAAEARNFNGGAGGWTESTTHSGGCVELVTCYGVSSSHQPNGGPAGDGDGYVRSELTTLLDVVISTNANWTSPEFTYRGVGGRRAQKLKLRLDRRTDLAAVLPVIDDDATYTVQALPSAGGGPVTLTDVASLAGAEGEWVSDPAVGLDPSALQVGADYRLRIVSRFAPGLGVLASGTVDYDNVVLRARRVVRAKALRRGVKDNIGPAAIGGNRVAVRIGCPPAARPGRCRLNTTGLLRKQGGRATATRRMQANAGRKRVAVLRLKPKHRAKVARRGKLWIKVKARSDGRKVTARKLVRLRRP